MKTKRWCSVFLLAAVASPVMADVPAEQQAEVQHLLNHLANSDCAMIRNDKTYEAEEATEHVQRKYDHYRDQITSTEEFIERSATRSLISGKAYHVACPGEDAVPSGEWLGDELGRYRAQFSN